MAIMLVTLLTSRVVLNVLGESDFGIYGLVGSVATLLGFVTSSLTSSCQRFYSYSIGKEDKKMLTMTFTTSLIIYIFLSILILIFCETIGLWFVNNNLNLPDERMIATNWIYQFAVLSFIANVISSPFAAMLISKERMDLYAKIAVLEVATRLMMAFSLNIFPFDKLIIYGFMMFVITLIPALFYIVICIIKFEECRSKLLYDANSSRSMIKFVSWTFLSNFAGSAYIFGTNVLINNVYGTVVNSAKSIASQVNSSVNTFASKFSSALNPQLVKNYASNNESDLEKQLFTGINITFSLIYVFALPLCIEMPFVLKVWLGDYPIYTIQFTVLSLIATCIEVTTYSLDVLSQATGNIKVYQIVTSAITLSNVPLSYIFLNLGFEPYIVLIIYIFLLMVSIVLRTIILSKIVNWFEIRTYFKKVILKVVLLVILTVPLPILIAINMESSIIRFLLIASLSVIEVFVGIFYILLSKEQRRNLIQLLKERLKR